MSVTHGIAGRSRKRTANVMVAHHAHNLNVATTGTADELLTSFTLPKGALEADGQAIRVTAHITGTSNSKTPTIRFGSSGVSGTNVAQLASTSTAMTLVAIIRRVSATTYNSIGYCIAATVSSTAQGTAGTGTAIPSSGNFDTTDILIALTSVSGTGAGDAVARSFMVEILPEGPSPALG